MWVDPESGEKVRQPETVQGAAPDDAWARHLAGGQPGLGIIPVLGDGTCFWAAIDHDVRGLTDEDLQQLADRIGKQKLPLIVCRSKSGGAHLLVFFRTPANAALAIDKLRVWRGALGLPPTTEIFPKQPRPTEKGGSWLNLPYAGVDATRRYAVAADGRHLTVDEFLDAADAAAIDPDDLSTTRTPADDWLAAVRERGPRCLREGFITDIEGRRNEWAHRLRVYLARLGDDNAAEDMRKACDELVNPLDRDEVAELAKRPLPPKEVFACVYRRTPGPDGEHKCPTPGECGRLKREVTAAHHDMPPIGPLTEITTTPRMYRIIVAGHELTLTGGVEDLFSLPRFRKLVFERTRKVIPEMKNADWLKFVEGLGDEAIVEEAPEGSGRFGIFRTYVEGYLGLWTKADDFEDILRGLPYRDQRNADSRGDAVFFQLSDLNGFLERRRFFEDERQIYAWLRDMKAAPRTKSDSGDGGKVEYAKKSIKGRKVNLWYIPYSELNEQTEAFSYIQGDLPSV